MRQPDTETSVIMHGQLRDTITQLVLPHQLSANAQYIRFSLPGRD